MYYANYMKLLVNSKCTIEYQEHMGKHSVVYAVRMLILYLQSPIQINTLNKRK